MRACAKDQVSLKGSTVEIKTNPSAGDTKGDYKISWEVSCLPSDSTGGVKLHTVLAAQKAGQKGHKVESWIPEGVEEFHLGGLLCTLPTRCVVWCLVSLCVEHSCHSRFVLCVPMCASLPLMY